MKILAKNAFIHPQFIPNVVLEIEGNRIVQIITHADPQVVVDKKVDWVLPGLIDLQLNGGGGAFFSNQIHASGIETIHRTHLKYGTTRYLITLTTTSLENIYRGIEVVRHYMENGLPGCLGMHLEGPYINPVKKGAHAGQWIRPPKFDELKTLITLGKDVIKMITIAPELFDEESLALLKDSGWVISAGHSMATNEEANQFFAKGVHKVTHLYNAMSPLESRAPGLVGATLSHSNVWASIIADGKHVHYQSIDLAYRLKPKRLFLISDASFKDEPGIEKYFGDTKVIYKDGFYYTETGRLAGASLDMWEAVQNISEHTSISIETAIEMASIRPAKVLGIHDLGVLKVGACADLLFLDSTQQVSGVMLNGQLM